MMTIFSYFRAFRDFCVTKLKTKISVCKFRYPHIGNPILIF